MWFVLAEVACVAFLLLLCFLISPTLGVLGVIVLLYLVWFFYKGEKDSVAARRREDEQGRAKEVEFQRRWDERKREFAEDEAQIERELDEEEALICGPREQAQERDGPDTVKDD